MIRYYMLLFVLLFGLCNVHSTSDSENLDSLNEKRLWTVAGLGSASYLTGLSYLSFVWYRDHERVPFHFYDDSKGYLQMDKWGHGFAAYYESMASYHALRWAGLDKSKALWWGGLSSFLFQTPIEIFDGMYEGWGFSWSDILANTMGSVIFISQEAFWDDQIVRMKFSYSPSGYPKYHSILGENELESFFLDYNGHTYWLSVNLESLTGMEQIPSWLNLAFGYSANGMIKEFENPSYYKGKPFPHLDRYRQYLFSLDIDLSRIKTDKPWLKKLLNSFNVLKIPFPAWEINGLGENRFYWLYY